MLALAVTALVLWCGIRFGRVLTRHATPAKLVIPSTLSPRVAERVIVVPLTVIHVSVFEASTNENLPRSGSFQVHLGLFDVVVSSKGRLPVGFSTDWNRWIRLCSLEVSSALSLYEDIAINTGHINSWSVATIYQLAKHEQVSMESGRISKLDMLKGDVWSHLSLGRFFVHFEAIGRSIGSIPRRIRSFLIGAIHSDSVVGVNAQNEQSKNTHPKRPPLKLVGFVLVSVIALTFFWTEVSFRADPFRLLGWVWFSGLVLSFGLCSYTLGTLIDYWIL